MQLFEGGNLKDAVAEREGRGTFLDEREMFDAKTNYPAQSLEMTEKELQELTLYFLSQRPK